MKQTRPNRYKRSAGGSRIAALAFLAIIVVAIAGYLLFKSPGQLPKPVASLPPAQQPSVKPQPVPPNHQAVPKDIPPGVAPKPEMTPTPLPREPAVEAPRVSGKGQLAVIIDDMGTSLQEAKALAGIGVPLTFSIIPGLRSYREVASFAASGNIETLIHIPMQSKGWPQRRLESNGLLLSMDEGEIRERIGEFMKDIPRAVGANNHMGSEFTEHEEKMRPVLEALKGKGLFFIDSATSPQSVGVRLAHDLAMKSGRRHVFLDNEQNPAYIKGQLNQAVALAKKSGSAIAICHPHPATIKALVSFLPDLERQGITLVPASKLVR